MAVLVETGSAVGFAQGIYAVTRRTRMHPGLGVFLPPVTNVVVAPLPLPNSFSQGSANSFVRRASPGSKPPSPEFQAELARKTLEFQIQRSKEGSAYAQYDLALRFLKGDGVRLDRNEALRLLGESAKQGNARAARKLVDLTRSSE